MTTEMNRFSMEFPARKAQDLVYRYKANTNRINNLTSEIISAIIDAAEDGQTYINIDIRNYDPLVVTPIIEDLTTAGYIVSCIKQNDDNADLAPHHGQPFTLTISWMDPIDAAGRKGNNMEDCLYTDITPIMLDHTNIFVGEQREKDSLEDYISKLGY